jgi:hypothetical protein
MFTANEGLVRIQYNCLVPIYVFPEMKLLFPKQNYNVLSPRSSNICEIFIYFQDRSACSAAWKYVDQSYSWEYINCSQTHECGNWQFPEKEYINEIFLAVLNLKKRLERTFSPMKNYTCILRPLLVKTITAKLLR